MRLLKFTPRATSQNWEAAYAEAMADWQRRCDTETDPLEKMCLMVELQERLRPDLWDGSRVVLTGIS